MSDVIRNSTLIGSTSSIAAATDQTPRSDFATSAVSRRARHPLQLLMHGFGDDQDSRSFVPNGGIAALSVRPSPRMGSSRIVCEDHLAGLRTLDLAGERLVGLVAARPPDLEAGPKSSRR